MTLEFSVSDIELCFVREFSTGGAVFGPTSSRAFKREAIRVAILKNKKEDCVFNQSDMTYAQAYRRCYGSPLELRATPRAVDAPIYEQIGKVIDSLEDSDSDLTNA